MPDWALLVLCGIIAAYKLIEKWIDARHVGDGETPPPGNDTLVETAYRDPARDDSERSIPDIRLGFQKE